MISAFRSDKLDDRVWKMLSQQRREVIDAYLDHEVKLLLNAFNADDEIDAIEVWLCEHVGHRCYQHPVHACLKGVAIVGDWDHGVWGDHFYFWFRELHHAALFMIMYDSRSMRHDTERRNGIHHWASFSPLHTTPE